MAIDYQSLAVKGVQALSPYQPGKPIEELARELGLNPAEHHQAGQQREPAWAQPKGPGGSPAGPGRALSVPRWQRV